MIKSILFLACGCWLFTHEVGGQNQKVVDSLTQVLAHKTGGERYAPLYELAFEYIDADNQRALQIIDQATDAALLAGDSLWIVKSMRVKGQILSRLERTKESIPFLHSAFLLARRQEYQMESVMIANTFGSIYLYKSQYDKALQYYFYTFEIAKQVLDTSYISSSLNNIGITYYKLKDYKKALSFLERALEIDKPMRYVGFSTLVNISLCYANLNDFAKAQIYINESLNVCGKNCPDKSMMHIKFAMGRINFELENYEIAEDQFLTSYTISKKIHHSRLQFDNINCLSEIYFRQQNIERAEIYLNEAEGLFRKGALFPLEVIETYSLFSKLYVKVRDFEKASHYQAKYIQLKDSIYNEELTTRLMKTEAEFMERENLAKIATQAENILVKEEVINRQWVLNVVTGLLAILTLIFSLFVFKNYRQKKYLNLLLDKKIRERTRELELSRDTLIKSIMEKEILVMRASEGISETIRTIKGLCFVGSKELSDPLARSYMDKIDKTSHRLSKHLNFLLEN